MFSMANITGHEATLVVGVRFRGSSGGRSFWGLAGGKHAVAEAPKTIQNS